MVVVMRWLAVFAVVALVLASVFSVISAQGAVVQAPLLETEYERVWVDSDGMVTAHLHTQPFQARRGGSWVPIDTTLAVRADGMVAPVAAAGDVVFSPGGGGALVRLGEMSLTWPVPLPRPVLAGDTATYAEAQPGVDLVLAARPTGFALSFVLKRPQARELRLQGETLKAGPNGTVTAGQVSGGPVGMRDAAGRSAHAVRSVRSGGLTVRPAQAMLDAAWTRYPVAVTQEFSADTLSWMVVGQSVTGQGYLSQWRPAGTVTAGAAGEYDYRAYVELAAVPVHGRHVRKATLRIQTCQEVEAWHIGPFGPATTWTETEYRELIGVTDCGDVDVTALMAQAATEGWQRISVAFAARGHQQPARFAAPLVEVQYR